MLITFVKASVALVNATPASLGRISSRTYSIACTVSDNCSLITFCARAVPTL
jgi:hypothetical protein